MKRLLRWLRLNVLSLGAVPRSRHETWVTATGDKLEIGEMKRSHLIHALALVVREARAGNYWYHSFSPNFGRLRFSKDPLAAQIREGAPNIIREMR